ncbi:SRPBCC family protein [Nocardia sp. NPDC051990]|uniref:SRPBCC family protein n=1 Tax=Nocardia sp. NPDC051990 TaxID=3155285 RepID=UPI00341CE156
MNYVPVTVESRCQTAPATAFEVIVPIDLSLIFTGMGPLPAVKGVLDQEGPWDAVGRTRSPQLSDGSTATERLVEYTPPHSFAYEIADFTGPLRLLVDHVRGEWTFTPDGSNCLVRWTYSFFPRPGLRPVVRAVAVPLWRRYAKATLARAIEQVERAGGGTPSPT